MRRHRFNVWLTGEAHGQLAAAALASGRTMQVVMLAGLHAELQAARVEHNGGRPFQPVVPGRGRPRKGRV